MMQAETVWHVWRRILREEPLQQALWGHGTLKGDDALAPFGLSDAQRQAALAYGARADRAKWFVLNYRFRLTNSFLNALETGAPMVVRALLNRGVVITALAQQFLDEQQWRDFGPFVYEYCDRALQFLATHEITAPSAGLRNLIGLERTVVRLMRQLAAPPAQDRRAGDGLLRRQPTALEFRSDSQLSVWLRDKKLLGTFEPPSQKENYLVYLPAPEAGHKYALISSRAMQILQALDLPCERRQLPERLTACGQAAVTPDDDDCLRQLQALRAIDGHAC